jgi:hypothetical protein
MEADLTLHERARLVAANRETARRMQELAAEWTKDIEEAQKNVEHVEELHAKIAAGTAMPDDMVEAADLLRHGVSPDDDDIPDAPCHSEDESSEEEKAKVGMKRKRAAKKTGRKRAVRKTEVGTEKRRRGRKAKLVDEPPSEWKIADGECE